MRFKHLLLASVILLLPVFLKAARACSCLAAKPPCAAYWKADAVFVGTVAKVFESGGGMRTVRFSLEHAYRGVSGKQVEIVNTMGSCEYEFTEGKKYFVYAGRNQASNTLGTSGCSRTTELSGATEDLAYAREVSGGKPEQSVSGIVSDPFSRAPIKGIRVNIRGGGRRYSMETDGAGRFKVLLPGTGVYTVNFILPPNSGVSGLADQLNQFNISYWEGKNWVLGAKVNLQAGRCAFFDVPLSIVKESP